MKSKIWQFCVIFLIFIRILIYIYSNWYYFSRPFDPAYYGLLYSKSQYVLGEKSRGGIGDDGLYAFAGYYYFFDKGDVSAVNFEHPPLGKYLIGLSILLFHNENFINLIYFFVLLVATYKISDLILKNNNLALASVLVVAFDPLFLDNLKRSLLDLPFSLFFVLGLYFFLLGLNKAKLFYLSNLFWGAAFSVRFFPAIILVFSFLILFLFLTKKNLKTFMISSLLVPLIYLLCHVSFFVYHPSFIEFLRHKKWMLDWFRGTVPIYGNIWRGLFTGYYINPTGKLMRDEYWTIILPFISILSLVSLKLNKIDLKKNIFYVVYILTVIYLLYVTFLTNGLHKFILPVYPLMVILALSNFPKIYCIILSCRKTLLKR